MIGGLDHSYPRNLPDHYPLELAALRPDLKDRNPQRDEETMIGFAEKMAKRFGPSVMLYVDPDGGHNLFAMLKGDGTPADPRVHREAAARIVKFALEEAPAWEKGKSR